MTEHQIFCALHRAYALARMESVAPHVSLGLAHTSRDGYLLAGTDRSVRRIDALIMFRSGSRWAVEIKVTAADLRQELRRPEKTALWLAHTHAFYYAVPATLRDVALKEVPAALGVIVVGSKYSDMATDTVRRSRRNPNPLPIPDDTWRRMARLYGGLHAERQHA